MRLRSSRTLMTCTRRRAGSCSGTAVPPRVPNGSRLRAGRPATDRRNAVVSRSFLAGGRVADREPADLRAPRPDSARAGSATRQHVRRCCRTRSSIVGRQQRRRRRCRAPADRGSRSGTRRGSAGERPGAARIRAGRRGAVEIRLRATPVNASSVGLSGRGRPAGGMTPVRSFLTTFSQTSAPAATFDTSMPSSVRPPVRSFSLWQVTQYFLISAPRSPVSVAAPLRAASWGAAA